MIDWSEASCGEGEARDTGAGRSWLGFYRANRRALTSVALALTGDPHNAEDLLQDVMLKMIRSGATPDCELAYVLAAMRNRWIDRKRRDGRRPAMVGDAGAFLNVAASPEDERADLICLAGAMAELTDDQRLILVMKHRAGLSMNEIARALDRPLGTIASHHRRAIERLRELLAEEVEHEHA